MHRSHQAICGEVTGIIASIHSDSLCAVSHFAMHRCRLLQGTGISSIRQSKMTSLFRGTGSRLMLLQLDGYTWPSRNRQNSRDKLDQCAVHVWHPFVGARCGKEQIVNAHTLFFATRSSTSDTRILCGRRQPLASKCWTRFLCGGRICLPDKRNTSHCQTIKTCVVHLSQDPHVH